MNLKCKLGMHKMEYVRTIEVQERGYIKVYQVSKCKHCGRLSMKMTDLVPMNIVQFGN